MSHDTPQRRLLIERFVVLFVSFLGQALLAGVFIAPAGFQDVGGLIGCGFGVPVAAAFSGVFMFRPIAGTITCSALTTIMLTVGATELEFESLSNPFIFLVVFCCVMGLYGILLPLQPTKVCGRQCPECGYSLQGLPPTSGCPECGWNRAPSDASR